MQRSRVTFAITEAAAIAALVESPWITGRCSSRHSRTGKPSVRQTTSSTPLATRSRLRPSAPRLVTWSPRESIPRTQRTVTATRATARITAG